MRLQAFNVYERLCADVLRLYCPVSLAQTLAFCRVRTGFARLLVPQKEHCQQRGCEANAKYNGNRESHR